MAKEAENIQLTKSQKIDKRNNIMKQKTSSSKFAISLLQNSSVYPVSKASHVQSKSRKIFWFAVFIFCTIGCSYDCYRFLKVYLQYPVLISIDLQRNT
ncbi:hypothetical protein X975_19832, partial [Stegodyphus mimosarum]